ncbi:hypothetical protein [Streptosporangium oxazolinicum]|uniref:hypothetical protein n=1 Tax=Streptosporangium oxazolinicum TaxID=909287 RepID=UPI0031EBDD7D
MEEVTALARAAANPATADDRLALAATAANKAALIASDCGLPGLARSLCHQQLTAHLCAQSMGAQAARRALEPVVNLARLKIRSGDGEGAYQLLDALYRAACSRSQVVIDGRTISFRTLTATDDDHQTVCQWLWSILLGDGTRALAGAGRWEQALAHVEQHHGVGQRLLDGRQVAILARCLGGDVTTALAMIEGSTVPEPWEQAVAACLSVACLRAGGWSTTTAVAAMVEHYLALEPTPDLLAWRTRLGVTVLDLAGNIEQLAAHAAARLVNEAVAGGDGYAAREVLFHDGCKPHLNSSQKETLSATVRCSGLGVGTIPPLLLAELLAAVRTSESVTTRL